jgi:hypothetical protein
MRVRREPMASSAWKQPELANRVMPQLKTDGRFNVSAEYLVQPPMGCSTADHPAPIHLLELVSDDRVGKEVGEVRKQVERVPLRVRADPRRCVGARVLAVDGERVPRRRAAVGGVDASVARYQNVLDL